MVKKSSLQVCSFFSGAMGLDMGLAKVGLTIRMASEIDKPSRGTIAANHPDLPLLGDVAALSAKDVLSATGLKTAPDVMVGGPPCQAFSTAGRRQAFNDTRGNVFLSYIDLIGNLAPQYVVIENVRGLLSAAITHRPMDKRSAAPASWQELPGSALYEVLRRLTDCGYKINFNLYNAANFGVPQQRERVVLMAVRGARSTPFPFLSPTHDEQSRFGLPLWTTFRKAVHGLPKALHHLEFPEKRLRFYRLLTAGQYWKHLPLDLQKEALGGAFLSGGGKTGFYRRLAWDMPSPTLVTHPAMPATDLAHPEANRPLAIEEYKRLQQFPDKMLLSGKLLDQYRQLGNAVPVGLGEAIGRALNSYHEGSLTVTPKDCLFSRYRNTSYQEWLSTFCALAQQYGFKLKKF